MNTDKQIIQDLIAGGVIGATLGALISDTKKSKIGVGALAGAAAVATHHAYLKAKSTNVPFLIADANHLYEITANGSKKRIGRLKKHTTKIASHFKLK